MKIENLIIACAFSTVLVLTVLTFTELNRIRTEHTVLTQHLEAKGFSNVSLVIMADGCYTYNAQKLVANYPRLKVGKICMADVS